MFIYREYTPHILSRRGSVQQNISELHHAKISLEIFVIVIPKDGLADISRAKPSFGITPVYRIVVCCLHRFHSIVAVLPKEGLAGLVPSISKSSFAITITKMLRPVFAQRGSSIKVSRYSRCLGEAPSSSPPSSPSGSISSASTMHNIPLVTNKCNKQAGIRLASMAKCSNNTKF